MFFFVCFIGGIWVLGWLDWSYLSCRSRASFILIQYVENCCLARWEDGSRRIRDEHKNVFGNNHQVKESGRSKKFPRRGSGFFHLQSGLMVLLKRKQIRQNLQNTLEPFLRKTRYTLRSLRFRDSEVILENTNLEEEHQF